LTISEVYRLIATEPCALWIGAGFSINAGYPSATNLKRLLFDGLTDDEKYSLGYGADPYTFLDALELKDFTQSYELIRSRDDLYTQLFALLTATPDNLTNHASLSKLGLFKTIITTNYDHLIEDAFNKSDVQVIFSNSTLTKINPRITQVYKIHGDIDHKDSLIITSEDYVRQYNRENKDPFWSSIFREISVSHTIFLCYGYRDENVKSDFDQIFNKLGNDHKKRFLVSPAATHIDLLYYEKNAIQYIKATPEEFLTGLTASLKRNLIKDTRDGYMATDTAIKILENFRLSSAFKKINGKIELTEIEGNNLSSETVLEGSLADNEMVSKLLNFHNSYDKLKLDFSSSDSSRFLHQIEGFYIADFDKIGGIRIGHIPNYSGRGEIEFIKNSTTLTAKYNIYDSLPGQILLEIDIYDFIISISIMSYDNGLKHVFLKNLSEPSLGATTRNHRRIYNALFNFSNGDPVKIYRENNPPFEVAAPVPIIENFPHGRVEFIKYLETIESAFNITFNNIRFDEMSEEEQVAVQNAYSLITLGYFIEDCDKGYNLIDYNFRILNIINNMSEKQAIYLPPKELHYQILGHILCFSEAQLVFNEPKAFISDTQSFSLIIKPSDGILEVRSKSSNYRVIK
jgi:hypothetical protein